MTRRAALVCLLLLPAGAAAQESASFLTLGAGARPAAMGGAHVALADDVDAAAFNPAGLALMTRSEAQIGHRESFADMRYDFLGFAVPGKRGTLAVSAGYLHHGKIAGRDAAGVETGGFNAADLSAGLSGAGRIPLLGLRLGAGLKYIESRIAEASAKTFAVDLGAQKELLGPDGPGTAVAGLAVRNIGPGLRFLDERSPLPLSLAMGIGYRLGSRFSLGLDYSRRPRAALKDEVAAGAEFAVGPRFSLRTGYASALAGTDGAGVSAALGGFSGGFGVKFGDWRLDYSMSPMGELGNAQIFSLAARFGAP